VGTRNSTCLKHSCYSCYSWSKSESSVIVVAFDLAEQPKGLTIVSARIEHHKRRLPHNRLQIIQKIVGPNQGPDAALRNRSWANLDTTKGVLFIVPLKILEHLRGDMDSLQFSGSGVFNVACLCEDLKDG